MIAEGSLESGALLADKRGGEDEKYRMSFETHSSYKCGN
jgi:hypothetical protein